jgi:hypothetical protein
MIPNILHFGIHRRGILFPLFNHYVSLRITMQFGLPLIHLAALANAATISIFVAESGLTFTPSSVTAEVGDT